MFWTTLALFFGSCILLVLFGSLLVRALTRLAQFLRINEFVAAFFLMAISTSLPELFVGISSSLANKPGLILGTIIGSNIADLTLVAGIAILVSRGVRIRQKSITTDAFFMVGMAAAPVILLFMGRELSRIDGSILLVLFGLHCVRLYKQRSEFVHVLKDHIRPWAVVSSMIIFVVSLIGLFYASEYVVRYGSLLAYELNAPSIFIGLFFLALGTSLPELVFESQAMFKRHSEMALGDLIGSVVVNSTAILGITALIAPITANFFLFITSSVFMLVVCFVFATLLQVGRGFTITGGICLILFYVLFLLIELNVRSPVFQTLTP